MFHGLTAYQEAALSLATNATRRMPIGTPHTPEPLPEAESVQHVQHHPAARLHQTGCVVGKPFQPSNRIQAGKGRDKAIEGLFCKAGEVLNPHDPGVDLSATALAVQSAAQAGNHRRGSIDADDTNAAAG